MSAFSKREDLELHCMPSMEEVMQYEVHGKPQPIRFRRTSREYSRTFFENWQKPLPFHSFFEKETDMNADTTTNVIRRKCPLEQADEEHTIASSSSHECLTRPCTCPDPGKSKEMCVIKKVENWLLGRCSDISEEVVNLEDSMALPNMPKWPHNVNKRPELEKYAVAALPPSVLLREIAGALFPVYILNVRVVGVEPAVTDLSQLVRGHCPYYSCNTIVKNIVWTNAGPLNYGKLARPYCPECCQTRRRRYLNLYFHLELHVEDNLGQMTKIIVERDAAVRFFGCTVYRFLLNPRRRLRIKKLLETLIRVSSSPRSAAVPGVTFDVRIIPIAVDHNEEVKFHMFGDNSPLCELAKKMPVPRP